MFDSDSSDGESDGEGESDPEVQPAVNTQEDVYSLSVSSPLPDSSPASTRKQDEESEPSFLALVPTFDDSPRAPLSFSPGPSTEYNNDFLQELAAPPVSPWKNLGLRLRPGPTYSSGDFKLGSGFELATAADGFLQDLESSPPPIFRKNGLCIDPSVRALGGESPLGPVFDSNRARFNTPPSEAKLPELFDRALVIKTPHCRLTSIRRPPLSPHNGQSGLPQPSDMSPHGRVLRFGM
ncbi:hypothetical protein B0H11DRAFT_247600 [Mycena galericulata]|nr:hypothetical protein B0H11DRAFT_247600 [Mycena galericulata]